LLSPKDEEKLNDIITLLRHSKDSSCIVLVDCINQILRNELEGEIRRRLGEEGFTFKKIKMSRNGDQNLPLLMKELKPKPNKIFFIYDLKKALPRDLLETKELAPILQYLNYRREDFVDAKVSALFWLDKPTLQVLAKRTPDFWAFRNLVVEFVEDVERLRFIETRAILPDVFRYASKKEVEDKIRLRKKALSHYLKTEPDNMENIASLSREFGLLYQNLSSYDQALEFYRKAYDAYMKTNDKKGQSLILSNIGEIYVHKGDLSKAEKHFKKALDISRRIGGLEAEGSTLDGLGSVYQIRGRWDESIKFYKAGLEIRKKIGDKHGLAETLNNIGTVYNDWGKYDQAVEYYKKSLKIKEEVGDRQGEGVTLNNIGTVYHDWGKYDQAIEYYKKSLKITEDIGDRRGEGATVNNIGAVYQAWGKYDQAIEYYKRSLKIREEVGDRRGEGVILNNIGMIYDVWGKYDQAIEYYKKSLKILEEVGAVEAKTVRERLKLTEEEKRS
jgi:tetratricopeptide (TPR) repeat protein